MSQRQQVALLLLAAVLIALVLEWQDGGISNQGTIGRYEFIDPTCEDAPIICGTSEAD